MTPQEGNYGTFISLYAVLADYHPTTNGRTRKRHEHPRRRTFTYVYMYGGDE